MRRALSGRSSTTPASSDSRQSQRRASLQDPSTVRFNITELNAALPIPAAPPAYSQIPRYHSVPPSGPPPPRSSLRSSNSAGILPTEPVSAARGRSRVEDPLKILQRYDLVFLIDDSPSMLSLWNSARESLKSVVEKAVLYDQDGVDIHFFNAFDEMIGCTNPADVEQMFKQIIPDGSTPTAMRLDDLLRPYVEECEDARTARIPLPKPKVLIIITDGEADDEAGVIDVIVEMAQRLDATRCPSHQLGLQFLQIGNDPAATEFLRRLDDDLKAEHGVRDICDTRTYSRSKAMSGAWIMEVLLGSVNRRVDAQRSEDNR